MINPLITQTKRSNYAEMIELWEDSVRFTHDFLADSDILHYKLLIKDYYFDQLDLYCTREDGYMTGFIGLKDGFVQLLFISPKAMRKGIGTLLLSYAINQHQSRNVDVNEQNIDAVNFYQKMGFKIVGRTARDAANKPFPVLSMTLDK